MSNTVTIHGVPVQFPFTPYDIQKDYMGKVIECLQNETTAVLESPTGTGKTLSLLCSSLAWLQLKKAQYQAERQKAFRLPTDEKNDFLDGLTKELEQKAGEMTAGRSFLGMPTIIYASRTHSQLTQAVQELKRTAYSHMRASVLGSREQLCINKEVLDEPDRGLRVQMCRFKTQTRTCQFNNRVDRKKDDPVICNKAIVDIEDMVKLGNKHNFCPYYMTKELKQRADIIFTPYNYLLDIMARKALGLDLQNSVIILDEAHNVEKVCEDSASIEFKTTDIALAIDELTAVMKLISEGPELFEDSVKGDINPDDLASFKEILLNLEKVFDAVPLNTGDEVTNYPGDYIFEILGNAGITGENFNGLLGLIDQIVQYLATKNDGPFARKGKGLQLFADFLTVAFASKATKEKIKHCYKVHIKEEEKAGKKRNISNWVSKGSTAGKCRILNFWCFSPGFGMELILNQNIKALILTSGTLAPLRPLISELELKVTLTLENPHIVKENQICVKIIPNGPDGETLNSSFQNRNNPKYISSLGRAIVNLARIIPHGLLIFFPSYPIMQSCQNAWQQEGIWSNIMSCKAIFVEPKEKDAFNAAMAGYYEKIKDPALKGAIFMAVCRGKVSEGLDFADSNGRAVIITGLPYPPLKDPRVILKRRYLDVCHGKDREYLSGSDWYSLEASRAVNQAIGRVIRHRHDYGAILLLDQRFNNFKIKEQMSKWLRDHIKVVHKYGDVIRDLSQFFRKAQNELPAPEPKPSSTVVPPAEFDTSQSYRKGVCDLGNSSSSVGRSNSDNSVISLGSTSSDDTIISYLGTTDNPNGTVNINRTKRDNLEPLVNQTKRKRITVPNRPTTDSSESFDPKTSLSEFVLMVKAKLGQNFKAFTSHLHSYCSTNDIEEFIRNVDPLVPQEFRYIFTGMDNYIRKPHKKIYREFLVRNNLPIPEDL